MKGWVCPTNQHWHQKIQCYLHCSMYQKNTQKKTNKQYSHLRTSSITSHITIHNYVCVIKNGVQFWVCMTNTDTKIFQCWIQWRNHLPCNAYLFGDAYSHLLGELIKSKRKGYQEATERVMYSINCMAKYSTPNLSVQSLTSDDDASSTDR